MKRFIRTKDNKIWDKTIHKIESVTYLTVPTVEKYKLYIFNNHEELIGQYFCTDIIAESDNVFDLIMCGDLCIVERDEKINDFIIRNEDVKRACIRDLKANYIKLSKLYTLQNENYILIWDKKRGVI